MHVSTLACLPPVSLLNTESKTPPAEPSCDFFLPCSSEEAYVAETRAQQEGEVKVTKGDQSGAESLSAKDERKDAARLNDGAIQACTEDSDDAQGIWQSGMCKVGIGCATEDRKEAELDSIVSGLSKLVLSEIENTNEMVPKATSDPAVPSVNAPFTEVPEYGPAGDGEKVYGEQRVRQVVMDDDEALLCDDGSAARKGMGKGGGVGTRRPQVWVPVCRSIEQMLELFLDDVITSGGMARVSMSTTMHQQTV